MLLCLSQGAFATNGEQEGQPKYADTISGPTEIFNTMTGRHINITNFDYAIALPNTGYKQTSANLATTFYNEVNDATIVISQPAGNHPSEEGAAYIINGIKAFIQDEKRNDRAIKTLSLFTHYPLIIEASCRATDTITINMMEKSLLSVVPTVMRPKDSHLFENSAFTIASDGYLPQCSGTNFTIFTPSGRSEMEAENGKGNYFQILVVNEAVAAKKQKKDAKSVISAIMTRDLKGSKIAKSKKTTINGLNGYEFELENKDRAEKSYAVVLYSSNRYYLFLSSANSDVDKNIALYKTIAQTLKTK